MAGGKPKIGIEMPSEEDLPPGPHRELVLVVHDHYGQAGKPSTRTISKWIRTGDDTSALLSHEGVSAVLHGKGIPRWASLESLVRALVTHSHKPADPKSAVERIHPLWLTVANGDIAPEPSKAPRPQPQPPEQQVVARWEHPRLGLINIHDRQTIIEMVREVKGFD